MVECGSYFGHEESFLCSFNDLDENNIHLYVMI